jgi:flavin-dependent dehydrogenase
MKTQVAIIGGGPGGSSAAMFLLREGIQPVIIEKEPFPRYHIGESMTGECGAVLRHLGLGDMMVEKGHPVKHGVKVYGKHPWFIPMMARTPEGELKYQSTWQVRRSDFDQMMLDEAVRRGATLIRGQALDPIVEEGEGVKGVTVRMADGGIERIESEMLLDCTGQHTFLATKGVTGPKYLGAYDKQIAIFSQVTGGIRDSGDTVDTRSTNTLIFYRSKFQWSWWIPLDEEVTSVGVVVPASYFVEKGESKNDFLTRELHQINPNLTERLPEINLVEDTRVIKNYSYQVKNFTGKGFMCLGDAHRFVDPIFSFGLYVTIKESQYAAPVVRDYLNGKNRDQENPTRDYQIFVEKGIDVLEDTLDSFWEYPSAFAMLVYHRHFDFMVDIFSGRIYEGQPSIAVDAFRTLLKRERTYNSPDEYSVPIGSRYHPERAEIWVDDPDQVPELAELLSE